MTLAEYRQVNLDQWVSMGPAAQARQIAQFGPPPAGWPRPSAALVPATVQYPVPQPTIGRPVRCPCRMPMVVPVGPSYAVHRTAEEDTSHGLHLFLTIITGALWAFVWIGTTIWHACGPRQRSTTTFYGAGCAGPAPSRRYRALATSSYPAARHLQRPARLPRRPVLPQSRRHRRPARTTRSGGRGVPLLHRTLRHLRPDRADAATTAGHVRSVRARHHHRTRHLRHGTQSRQGQMEGRTAAVRLPGRQGHPDARRRPGRGGDRRTIFNLCTRDRLGSKAVAAALNDRGCDVVAPPVRTRKAAARHPPTLV